jgi:CheY-like chemotaxis protein
MNAANGGSFASSLPLCSSPSPQDGLPQQAQSQWQPLGGSPPIAPPSVPAHKRAPRSSENVALNAAAAVAGIPMAAAMRAHAHSNSAGSVVSSAPSSAAPTPLPSPSAAAVASSPSPSLSVSGSAASTPGGPSSSRSLHILIVEDQLVNQKLLVKMLSKLGHTSIVAENGAVAVAAVRDSYGRGSTPGEGATGAVSPLPRAFDAILMDIQMPVMDGIEATSTIRAWMGEQRPRDPPLVILGLTAHAQLSDKERCMRSGMDFVLTKPITFAELRTKLQLWTGPNRPARGSV